MLENSTETAVATPENSPAPSPAHSPTPQNETAPQNQPVAKTGFTEKIRATAGRIFDEAGFTFHKGRGRPKNCPACKNKLPEKSTCPNCEGRGTVPGKLDGAIAGVPPLAVPSGIPENSPMAGATLAADAGGHRPATDNGVSTLFRRTCVRSVKGLLAILKAIVGTYAEAAEIDSDFTAKTLAKADPDPEALEDFTESLDAVMKKRNIQPENAEEWALVISGARLVAPYALLIAEFKGEIRRKRKAETK